MIEFKQFRTLKKTMVEKFRDQSLCDKIIKSFLLSDKSLMWYVTLEAVQSDTMFFGFCKNREFLLWKCDDLRLFYADEDQAFNNFIEVK